MESPLNLIDQVLRDIGNSQQTLTIPVSISTSHSQTEENKTTQVQLPALCGEDLQQIKYMYNFYFVNMLTLI